MTRTIVGFIVGIVLGAAVWWASPHIVGYVEPWDATVPYYPLALFVAGMIAALVDPYRLKVSACGIYLGQFLYAFFILPGGPLWIVGMVFGAMYLLCSLLGGRVTLALWQFSQNRKISKIEQRIGQVSPEAAPSASPDEPST